MKFSFLILTLIISSFSMAAENKCSEIVSKTVSASEFITDGKSFSKLKSSIVNQALSEAVKQEQGTEIRDYQSLDLSSVNGNESENYKGASFSKTRGVVKSYEILSEKINDLGAGKVLEIKLTAEVCILDKSNIRDVLLVGDFLHNGRNLPAFTNAVRSVFSRKNKKFELGSGHPKTDYYDISITGRLDQISKDLKIDKEALQGQQSAKVFQGFLGMMQKDKSKPNPFAGFVQSIGDTSTKLNEVYLKVYVSLNAVDRSNNRNFTSTASSEKTVSEDSVNNVIDSLGIDATRKASIDLFDQLVGNERNTNAESKPKNTSQETKDFDLSDIFNQFNSNSTDVEKELSDKPIKNWN